MKQKILLVSLVCCMVALSACGNESNEPTEQSQEHVETAQKESESLYQVTINGVEKAKDWEDKDCVVVGYTFTNNSDENIDFSNAVSIDVFQNGIEQSFTNLVMSGEAMDNDNYYKTIQPSTTIECQRAYLIEDNSDITVEVYDYYNEAGEVLIAEKMFELE